MAELDYHGQGPKFNPQLQVGRGGSQFTKLSHTDHFYFLRTNGTAVFSYTLSSKTAS